MRTYQILPMLVNGLVAIRIKTIREITEYIHRQYSQILRTKKITQQNSRFNKVFNQCNYIYNKYLRTNAHYILVVY